MECFQNAVLHIWNFNIISIDEDSFIGKQSNASIVGISESKLDSFIWNIEEDI